MTKEQYRKRIKGVVDVATKSSNIELYDDFLSALTCSVLNYYNLSNRLQDIASYYYQTTTTREYDRLLREVERRYNSGAILMLYPDVIWQQGHQIKTMPSAGEISVSYELYCRGIIQKQSAKKLPALSEKQALPRLLDVHQTYFAAL